MLRYYGLLAPEVNDARAAALIRIGVVTFVSLAISYVLTRYVETPAVMYLDAKLDKALKPADTAKTSPF